MDSVANLSSPLRGILSCISYRRCGSSTILTMRQDNRFSLYSILLFFFAYMVSLMLYSLAWTNQSRQRLRFQAHIRGHVRPKQSRTKEKSGSELLHHFRYVENIDTIRQDVRPESVRHGTVINEEGLLSDKQSRTT